MCAFIGLRVCLLVGVACELSEFDKNYQKIYIQYMRLYISYVLILKSLRQFIYVYTYNPVPLSQTHITSLLKRFDKFDNIQYYIFEYTYIYIYITDNKGLKTYKTYISYNFLLISLGTFLINSQADRPVFLESPVNLFLGIVPHLYILWNSIGRSLSDIDKQAHNCGYRLDYCLLYRLV